MAFPPSAADQAKAGPGSAGETNARLQTIVQAGAADRQQRPSMTKAVRVPKSARKPDAFRPRAVGKSMVERPILKQVMPEDLARSADDGSPKAAAPATDARRLPPLIEVMTPAMRKTVASLWGEESRLDAASRRFMMAKLPRKA